MKRNAIAPFLLPVLTASFGLLLAAWLPAQTVASVHNFTIDSGALPGNSDGTDPVTRLVLSGNMLYGTAAGGGSQETGTVFKIATDGTGFAVLHRFTSIADGNTPEGRLLLTGSALYGTTKTGGGGGHGAIFRINTDGTGYTNLYSFTPTIGNSATNSDGANPQSGLILSGNTLYGAAFQGGSMGYGTLFRVDTDGGNFTNLYNFSNGFDGANPAAELVLSGNTLYGTASSTFYGSGAIYKINTDGTGFTYFSIPFVQIFGSLLLSGDTLYGTSYKSDGGAVFALNTNGNGFTNLYVFTGGSDGADPYGGLVLSGSMLYGTAALGGASSNGTVYAVNTNGTGFTNLYSFTPTPVSYPYTNGDGREPYAGLAASGGALYGVASGGGGAGNGTVFALDAGGAGFTNLYSFTALNPYVNTNDDGAWPEAGLILSGNTLYGTTWRGGIFGFGAVFRVNPDGTGFANLHSFAGGTNDGAYPMAGLTPSGNILYGTTAGGPGGVGSGTVFAVNTDGTGFTNLHSFGAGDGYQPYAGLVLSAGRLYGVASQGGSFVNGTVFALNPDGSAFTNLHSFTATTGTIGNPLTNSDGANPYGTLALSGATLFGTAYQGGGSGNGTVFAINTDGTGFTNLHSFTATSSSSPHTNSDGANPLSGLTVSGGTIYGTAGSGGTSGNGTVFTLLTNGTGFTVLHRFTGRSAGYPFNNNDGASPNGGLALSGNILYGTTRAGGSSGNGIVFKVTTDGMSFKSYYSFTGPYESANADGALPNGGLVLSGNVLYGTAYEGGLSNRGTVFVLYTTPKLALGVSGPNVVLSWPTTNSEGFTLQSAGDLGPSAVWNPVSPAPVIINGHYTVTNAISGVPVFYRLSQ